jgi:2-desacetyl-2-hydroxyethyl bacteriochlorophyllide A dehydrogenase
MAEAGRRLVQVGGDRVEIETFDVPEPGPGEVLVRVSRSQISAGSERGGFGPDAPSDRRRYLGYTTVGRVQAVGPGVEGFAAGDRVVAWGPHGSHWLATPDPELGHLTTVQHVEYDLADEQAAFSRLGDVALHGVRRAELQIGESVAVFGQGVVGQLVAGFCRISGAYPVIGVDLDTARLEMATTSGATHTVNASEENAVEAVRAIAEGGVLSAFHVARDPCVLVDCMQAAADHGKVMLVGSPPGTVDLGLQVDLLRRELDIRGTYATDLSRPHKYWPWTQQGDRSAIMRLIASGELKVDHLISHVARPEEASEIYRMIAAGTTGWMSVFFDWE